MRSNVSVDELWRRFKTDGDQKARERLIVHYSPVVKYVAGRVAAGLPQSVDQADLVSNGMFGLIDAIEKFDTERGFQFETYAIPRIRGAIIDEMRAFDWVPRSVRNKSRQIEQAISKFEAQHGRAPNDTELAESLEWTEAQLGNALQKISVAGLVAIEELSTNRSGEEILPDALLAEGGNPVAALEDATNRKMLADALNRMGEREKVVVTLYYYEGLTMAEIGQVLGVTESRVCQIHAKAVLSMRNFAKQRGVLE